MDLKNNQIGLNLYYSLNVIPNDYISYFTVLQIELMSKINNGDLWIISNLDSNSNPTPFSTLIRSNE